MRLIAEALKSTRLVLQPMSDCGTAVVGVLSVLPNEGKSTFALSFAEMLRRRWGRGCCCSMLILVTGGMAFRREPCPRQRGDWRIAATTDLEDQAVMLIGQRERRGDLSSIAVQEGLAEARGQFDYVII